MGFLDRLLGRRSTPQHEQTGTYTGPGAGGSAARSGGSSADEQAIARYKYLLRTAPPERLEEAHAEAFARLTPQQRQQVLAQLSQTLPASEAPRSDDPREMARATTRAEMMQPGYVQRTFGGVGMGGMGMGGAIMGSMMGTMAGVVLGTAVADAMFDDEGFASSPEAAGEEPGDMGDAGDAGEGGDVTFDDPGSGAEGAWDGGGASDGGFGDVGGGDFGSDFGGGDMGGGFGDF